MGERVRENHYALVGPYHSNFAITKTGLHISTNYPHLGASPDRIIDCNRSGKGLVEIKCPHTGLKGWENDKNFAIDLSKMLQKIIHILHKCKGKCFCLVYSDFFCVDPSKK